MTQLTTLLLTKRTPIRVHKPLPKPVKCLSPVKDTIATHLSQSQPIRSSYSPSRIRQKRLKPKVDFQFNLCASKDVFVFSRKCSPVKLNKKNKQQQNYKGQLTQEIFCGRNEINRPLYRTTIRSQNSKRQKSQDICQRKSSSETNISFFSINPGPWQINGEGHEFETLL